MLVPTHSKQWRGTVLEPSGREEQGPHIVVAGADSRWSSLQRTLLDLGTEVGPAGVTVRVCRSCIDGWIFLINTSYHSLHSPPFPGKLIFSIHRILLFQISLLEEALHICPLSCPVLHYWMCAKGYFLMIPWFSSSSVRVMNSCWQNNLISCDINDIYNFL